MRRITRTRWRTRAGRRDAVALGRRTAIKKAQSLLRRMCAHATISDKESTRVGLHHFCSRWRINREPNPSTKLGVPSFDEVLKARPAPRSGARSSRWARARVRGHRVRSRQFGKSQSENNGGRGGGRAPVRPGRVLAEDRAELLGAGQGRAHGEARAGRDGARARRAFCPSGFLAASTCPASGAPAGLVVMQTVASIGSALNNLGARCWKEILRHVTHVTGGG